MDEEEIFHQALERGPDERAAYLERACAGDPALRASVEALLRANVGATGFLERPASVLRSPAAAARSSASGPADTVAEPAAGAGPDTAIGPYKLLEPIGEGGFGVVFLAEQTGPVRRKVALKMLKPGMDTRQVVARFEAERQALAIMDHPNIARVFDGGATPSGRPYFVMELVKGVPITEFCDRHHLTPQQRLELFLPVCEAVQHAHQKGIIHRDLKPSNLLVAMHDTAPVVKVIDFGVAKALGQELTDKTLCTGIAQMVGTPLYMSPEQAGMSDLDIDTRSDIYSLGVLLYELLTGTTPFTRERFQQAAYDEIRRIIREEDPPRPSTRLSESTGSLPSISALRRTEPARLPVLVRGELDWIVMKCLEKDRDRRYETASGLARDLERYLRDEPVQACPPSAGYRFRKLARRRRGAFAVAGVIAVALLLAVSAIGWAVRDRSARHADAQRVRTARQAKMASELDLALDRAALFQGQGKRAEALAAMARAELLAGEAPSESVQVARLAALKERLAADALDQEFMARFEDIRLRVECQVNLDESRYMREAAAPEIGAALRRYGMAIGGVAPEQAAARALGRPEPVQRSVIAALDECLTWTPKREPQTRSWLLATLAAADADPWRAAVRKARLAGDEEALERLARDVNLRRQPPGFLLLVADSLRTSMGSSRLELYRRIQRAYPADLWANHGLAWKLWQDGQSAEAVRYYTAAVALRPDNPGIYLNRGNALARAGELDAAIADYRWAIALAPQYASVHGALGSALKQQGHLDEAIAEFREGLRLKPDYPAAHNNLGNALRAEGDLAGAVAEFRQAVRLKPDTATYHFSLGSALDNQGLLDEAIPEYREAIRLNPDYAAAHNNLGNALRVKGNVAGAAAEFRQAVRRKPDLPGARDGDGNALEADGEPAHSLRDEAVAEYRRAIRLKAEFARAVRPTPDDAAAHLNLGNALKAKGQWEEAIAEYREALRLRPTFSSARVSLGTALLRQGRPSEAKAVYREAVRMRPEDPAAHYTLGTFLRGQGELVEAEAEIRAVLRFKPNYAPGHFVLGNLHAQFGRWDQAAGAFTRGLALEPGNHVPWYQAAVLRLHTGDVDGYRRACRELLERFGKTGQPEVAERIAKTWLLRPDAAGAPNRIHELADLAVAGTEQHSYRRYFLLAKALADCRAGRCADAVAGLKRFAPQAGGWSYNATAFAVLALAEHGLGHADEARAALTSARAIVAHRAPSAGRPFESRDNWHDWLHAEILSREAEGLLGRRSPGTDREPNTTTEDEPPR